MTGSAPPPFFKGGSLTAWAYCTVVSLQFPAFDKLMTGLWKSIPIYTRNVAPSPKGEGWDEGKYKCLILFSSPQPSPTGEGA